MTIHILVEGPSERALLARWSPRLLPGQTFRIHPHQGKGELPKDLNASPDGRRRGLLDQLPAKLRGFAQALDPATDRVVVLVDADNDDLSALFDSIEAAATHAGSVHVLVRIAVEETEAFYLGDLRALKTAFPKADMHAARKYKPDSICATWELFGRIVGDNGANKVAWAEAMGPVLTTKAAETRSPSLKKLITGLLGLSVNSRGAEQRRRAYKHPTRPGSSSGKR